jgi:hypothetical protein
LLRPRPQLLFTFSFHGNSLLLLLLVSSGIYACLLFHRRLYRLHWRIPCCRPPVRGLLASFLLEGINQICCQNLPKGTFSLPHRLLRSSTTIAIFHPNFSSTADHQYKEPTEHTSESQVHSRPDSPTESRAWSYSSHHVVMEQRVSALIQPQNFRTRSKNKRKRRSYSLPRTARGNLEFQIIEREGSAPPKPPISLLLRGCSGV